MSIFRLHAYSVEPTRTTVTTIAPVGGEIRSTPELEHALNRSIRTARFGDRTLVDFQVDTTTRSNEVRDLVLSYAFGDDEAASTAAESLASRVSNAMDLRSTPGLFVMAAEREDDQCTVFLWTFPRDEAFQFRSGLGGPSIQILTDVFSQTSRLRKAARFRGRNLRNEFLRGRVLDFQVNQKSKAVADFWIAKFLQCGFGLRGDAGTRLIARAFRASFDSCDNFTDREQLFVAMLALRSSPRRRWSPQEISEEYLSGDAQQAFLDAIPNQVTRSTTFEFQTEVLDRVLRFRIFELDTGVFVSSPPTEIGQSVIVIIEDTPERHLTCEGLIVGEKVRTQHA